MFWKITIQNNFWFSKVSELDLLSCLLCMVNVDILSRFSEYVKIVYHIYDTVYEYSKI